MLYSVSYVFPDWVKQAKIFNIESWSRAVVVRLKHGESPVRFRHSPATVNSVSCVTEKSECPSAIRLNQSFGEKENAIFAGRQKVLLARLFSASS
jgi:hypothetical protein